MAQHIKEIRDLLVELHKDKNIQIQTQVEETPVQPNYNTESCPACGKRVSMDDTVCPECGLTLANTEN
ncbi:zinc ribbon domain-containing protein [Paenibacillus alvei]|uniref:zinc ribbon domain-containing protein n=1 Tax=Paenibacillus alvei TaxID=44250 RepID=UPI00041C60EA